VQQLLVSNILNKCKKRYVGSLGKLFITLALTIGFVFFWWLLDGFDKICEAYVFSNLENVKRLELQTRYVYLFYFSWLFEL